MKKGLLAVFLLLSCAHYQGPYHEPPPKKPSPEEWERFRTKIDLLRVGDPEQRLLGLFQDLSVDFDQTLPKFGRIGIK